MDATETRNHIEHKFRMGELKAEVATRMLDALDAGAPADYPSLLERATFLPPPPVTYHTAPRSVRDQIAEQGLLPGSGTNWGGMATGQPSGVYVGPTADVRGVWAHWPDWDVWMVDMTGLAWEHDRLNPGCWVIPDGVPPEHLRLVTS